MAYDFSNSANWELIYTGNHRSQFLPNSRYFYPLPAFKIPVQLESNIICTKITSPNIPSYWKFAGHLIQKTQIGIEVGGVPDGDLWKYELWLNKLQITEFEKKVTSYSVEIEIAKWLSEIDVKIWLYSGSETSEIEDLLQRIEGKIDTILG